MVSSKLRDKINDFTRKDSVLTQPSMIKRISALTFSQRRRMMNSEGRPCLCYFSQFLRSSVPQFKAKDSVFPSFIRWIPAR